MKTHNSTGYIYMILLMFLLISSSCDVVGNSDNDDNIDWKDFGELVPADDELLSDEQRAAYRQDAEKLAVRYINEEDSTQTEIPEELIELYYHGLAHIALSDHEKAVEATQEFEVHAREPVHPREIIVQVDTTASWIDAWRNEMTETGNSEIDAFLEEYNFTLIEYSELANVLPTAMATLRSDRAINGYAVGRQFEDYDDIESAGPDGVTDGSDISVLFFDNRLRYTFEYGFGDCPAGCINRHSWKFDVNRDGTVTFVEEEGDSLPED